jgi:hypothetical protein
MSRVYVTSRHFEPHSHTLTGLTLHVQFEGGTADVSMLDMSGLPEPDRWNPGCDSAGSGGERLHGLVPHHP